MSPRWSIRPAAVALDLLDGAEREEAARLLATDVQFRAEVDRLRGTTQALGDLDLQSWRPAPPPPLDDDRAVTLRPPAAPRRRTRRRLALGAGALAAAAAVAAAVLVAAGGDDGGPAGPDPTLQAALTLHTVGGAHGAARLAIHGADARLQARGLAPNSAHDYYEAWLADARGRMVSMGTFHVGRSGRVDAHMPIAVDVRRYRVVDVSLEPDDGNPAHSATSVLRATIPRTL
ncbi:anti-sigma factor [Baekduia soli]|uniref:Anti-sigma factor n=1 Tax=Baekduia soli TaxID=496014 RepID=A0A5B8U0V5_9ACTN|nr:anti-sigma factor [Baekduia soli]QEC46621.1 anti-sigma factor [Baekduia soli]